MGQADSGLIPTSPREMFACSGIYSHSLWIKERMGIIFPVEQRHTFSRACHRRVARQFSLGPLEPAWELTLGWGGMDSGAVLRWL